MPVWTPETTSTQDAVRTWAMAQRPTGSSLLAAHQTEGRGRLGRSWIAGPGQALLTSILLRPQVPLERLGLLPLAAAVGVRVACRGRLAIKWPNDLLGGDGRKVAGLLAESEVKGGRVSWVVIGIGLNQLSAPRDVPTAGFLHDYGPPVPIEDLAVDVISQVLQWTDRVATDPALVLQRWRHGSATLGRVVRVGERVGVAEDVAEDGALLLRTGEGTLERVVAGDVVHVVSDEEHDA
ncbi:MAG: biotin--[acetyl-CoA-carboxylase] ligase [Myxococcales bacterium]|nr:biotin--[acetyl-CoA-carboxylase] ligase [Myxococcales bacterium]